MKKRYQDIFNGRGRREWLELIGEWIHSELDRKLIIRAYLDGITYETLEGEFGISAERIEKRVNNAREQLFRHLPE